jgi:hypothetical protein
MTRKRIALAAAIVTVATVIVAWLFLQPQLQNIIGVQELTSFLSTTPDLSFLKTFGLNISFGELLVLCGAALLFLVIGIGLGRTTSSVAKKAPHRESAEKLVKSEVKSALGRPSGLPPRSLTTARLSAEERLLQMLGDHAKGQK